MRVVSFFKKYVTFRRVWWVSFLCPIIYMFLREVSNSQLAIPALITVTRAVCQDSEYIKSTAQSLQIIMSQYQSVSSTWILHLLNHHGVEHIYSIFSMYEPRWITGMTPNRPCPNPFQSTVNGCLTCPCWAWLFGDRARSRWWCDPETVDQDRSEINAVVWKVSTSSQPFKQSLFLRVFSLALEDARFRGC